MSGMRRRRIDRARAAELLSGRGSATPDRLSDVLSAASAPPRSRELDGEEYAVAAFHRERLSPAPVPPSGRRLALVKVAGLVLAGLSLGGVAFAANGILPGPVVPPPVPAPSAPPASEPGMSRTEEIAPERSTTPSTSPTTVRPPRREPLPQPSGLPSREPSPLPTHTGRPQPWPVPTSLPVPTELPLPTSLPPLPTGVPTTFPDLPGLPGE